MNLLELQDHTLTLRNAQGVLASAPGFANLALKEPVFGAAAQQIARLHPRQLFNQYWQQLSVDPLPVKTKLFRHHADLAYAQLQQLCQSQNLSDGVVIAAPASYTRSQLSVLLGILKQCSFPSLALVDHGLLQAASTGANDCIVLDLQLHQAVLANFRVIEGVLQKANVVQIPSAGLLALHDAWTSVIVDAFLQQSRFDPTHGAETEQYIANELPTWLRASSGQSELLLELNHRGTIYQARLQHSQFIERSKSIYARIARELPQVQGANTSVHCLRSHLTLPGLTTAFSGIAGIADEASVAMLLQHSEALVKPGGISNVVTKLPLSTTAVTANKVSSRPVTHLLYRHEARALPQGRLLLGQAADSTDYARVLPLADSNGAVVLLRTLRGITVENVTGSTLLCNGQAIAAGYELQLGDVLHINDQELQLIAVE